MNRPSLTAVAIAAVGVLAIALAAATLPSTVDPETGVGGDGSGGDGGEPGFGSPPADRPIDAIEVPFLAELLAAVLALAVLLGLVYLLRNWRGTLPVLIAVAALTGLLVIALWLVGDAIPVGGERPPAPVGEGGFPGGNGDDGVGTGDSVPVPAVVLVVLTLAALGVLLATVRSPRTRVGPTDAGGDGDLDEADRAAIGRAAGRAADRIEGGEDVENDVIRAWREMTSLLEVAEPETTTAGEFATAAVEAGMNPDDVRELTRLFEDVRYGGYDPTADRERRAIRVFRRIESEYGGEDS